MKEEGSLTLEHRARVQHLHSPSGSHCRIYDPHVPISRARRTTKNRPTTLADVFPATACVQTSFAPRTQVFLRSLSNTAARTLHAHDCVLHHSAQLLAEAMLEADFEAAAGRIFNSLLGVIVEGVGSQPAIMRIQVCQGALTQKRALGSV